MITQQQREAYRKGLKEIKYLRDLIEQHMSRGKPLSDNVMRVVTTMTDTTELPRQYAALKQLYNDLDAQYDEQLRYAAQFQLSPFCEYMNRDQIPALHHEFLIDHMEAVHTGDVQRLAISAPPGSAKALALDTPIPTPNGWKNMGNLVVGDQVFDENGEICTIKWVSPVWKDRPVYAVKTDCGDEIIADHDHEWQVRLCSKHPVFKIKETHELAKKRAKRPMILRAKSLKLPEVLLTIDPYILGYWLGDGDTAGLRITCAVTDQLFVIPEFNKRGYSTTTHKEPLNFGVIGVRHHFVEHNLLGNKHIPEVYMRASAAQRLALLQGLNDSDGTVCKKRGNTTFCNTNKALALQVRELVVSLGVKAGWSVSRAVVNGKDCGEAYKVSFYMKGSCLLPRKEALTRDQYRTPNTYIDALSCGVADTVCIEVDSPSHLFLCGRSMTPTHNSTYASHLFPAWHLGRRPNERWLQGAHTMTFAKDRLGKVVRGLISEQRYRDVFPDMGISSTSAAADYFEFTNGCGYYKAVGVGTGIAGYRFEMGAIDDPIASREDAESPTFRRKLHSWFEDDFGTRPSNPKAPIYIVNTRWHEDDLVGHELQKMAEGKGEEWTVLNIPALAEADDLLGRKEGEGLWPEHYGTEFYLKRKRISTGRSWNSMYQGHPTDEEGGVLKREDVSRYTKTPKNIVDTEGNMVKKVIKRVTLSVDCAEKATERSDYTAATVWVESGEKKHYLIHAARTKKEFSEMVQWIEQIARTYKVDQILVEDRGAGTQYIQVRKNSMGFAPVIPIATKQQSKSFRFDGVTPMFAAGEVFLPETGLDWIADLEAEIFAFPAGRNDDYVDTISQYLAYSRENNVTRGTRKLLTH